jgi:peptide/nickel transport system substrate-binding protein
MPSHPGPGAQAPEARMRIAINVADIQTLDPHFAVTNPDRNISDMVFNGLLRFTPGDSNSFEPDLATEMPTATSNDDGTQTWTFTLRDDVFVHAVEGVESYRLTSADVVFSFEKVSNPETSAFSGDYDGWLFDAPDDMTVNITLPFPISETLLFPRISNYSGGYVIPRLPYETLGRDRFSRQPVGTGPFIFSSHTPQNNVTLVANEAYFRGPADAGLGGAPLHLRQYGARTLAPVP